MSTLSSASEIEYCANFHQSEAHLKEEKHREVGSQTFSRKMLAEPREGSICNVYSKKRLEEQADASSSELWPQLSS